MVPLGSAVAADMRVGANADGVVKASGRNDQQACIGIDTGKGGAAFRAKTLPVPGAWELEGPDQVTPGQPFQ